MGGGHVAGVEDAERVQQLAAEVGGAAPFPGQRREGFHDAVVALVLAEPALDAPDAHDYARVHAVARLHLGEQGTLGAVVLASGLDAALGQDAGLILGPGQRELGLAPIQLDDALVRLDACEGGGEGRLADSGPSRLGLHARDEALEAALSEGGCGQQGELTARPSARMERRVGMGRMCHGSGGSCNPGLVPRRRRCIVWAKQERIGRRVRWNSPRSSASSPPAPGSGRSRTPSRTARGCWSSTSWAASCAPGTTPRAPLPCSPPRAPSASPRAARACSAIARAIPLLGAAFLNGALGHSLDFDDTHAASSLHPGATVIPAALAAGEMAGASGADVLAAVVAGYEVTIRIALALPAKAHYDRGFHPTATCGAFGAAAAAARVFGLDAAGVADALGIALSQAAGSLQFLANGAWTKRFQVGWASLSGLAAATLAREGFKGASEALEGRHGFLRAYAPEPRPELALDGLGERYELMQTAVKPWPSCRYGHACIGAALDVRAEPDFDPARIEGAVLGLPRAGLLLVGEPAAKKSDPHNVVDGQFSGPFVVAAALLTGRMDWDSYRAARRRGGARPAAEHTVRVGRGGGGGVPGEHGGAAHRASGRAGVEPLRRRAEGRAGQLPHRGGAAGEVHRAWPRPCSAERAPRSSRTGC